MARAVTDHSARGRTAPALQDLAAGLLISLTFSVALAVDLATQAQNRRTIAVTVAIAVALVAVTWSLGRWMSMWTAAGRKRQGQRDEPFAHPPASPRARWTTWLRGIMADADGQSGADTRQAARRVAVTAASCWLGGLLPVVPYLWPLPAPAALLLSATVTAGALGALGAASAGVAGLAPRQSALQALAAGVGLAGIIYVLIVMARLTAAA